MTPEVYALIVVIGLLLVLAGVCGYLFGHGSATSQAEAELMKLRTE